MQGLGNPGLWHNIFGAALPFYCVPANVDKVLMDMDLVTVAE